FSSDFEENLFSLLKLSLLSLPLRNPPSRLPEKPSDLCPSAFFFFSDISLQNYNKIRICLKNFHISVVLSQLSILSIINLVKIDTICAHPIDYQSITVSA